MTSEFGSQPESAQHGSGEFAGSQRSRALHRRGRAVVAGGNSRATLYARPYPRYAVSGHGAWVVDADGNELLDCLNNYTSLIHGHAFAPVVAAVEQQVHRGSSFGLPTEAEVELAELLTSRVPHWDTVRFMNSGTEAVMQSIKAARAFTGRPAIAKCEGAYHGTYDFVEVSLDSSTANWGDPERPAAIPYAAGTPRTVLDEVVILPFNGSEASRQLLLENRERLAAVLVDPMPNRLGFPMVDRSFLKVLREVTMQIGALLIFDEVITFRLGPAGAQGLDGFVPDLTTLGKIIGGGLPVGAVAGRAEVMDVFADASGRALVPHGGTFNANPLTMAAGLAAMTALGSAEFARLDAMGLQLRTALEGVLEEAGIEGRVTGRGSLFRIHFGPGEVTDYRTMSAHSKESLQLLTTAMLRQGVLLGHDGLGCLSTVMRDADLDLIAQAFTAALPATRQLGA